MKHTKSMIYKPTAESTDLFLYTVNTGEIYRRYTLPVIANLAKKYQKGTYNQEKAVDAFYRIATAGAAYYAREFCTAGKNIFDVTARYTVAVDMEKRYFENINGENPID